MTKQQSTDSFRKFLHEKIDLLAIGCISFSDDMRKSRKLAVLADQLIRSAGSIGANIHEARDCKSRKDYARFFEYALRSSHESAYWLSLAGKIEPKLRLKSHKLGKQCDEVERILIKTLLSLRSRQPTSSL